MGNTTYRLELTGEALIEVKNVNARKVMRLERRRMFAGVKKIVQQEP